MGIIGRSPLRQQYGFTALELLSALTVSLILMTVGIPAVQNLTTSSSMTAAVNNIAVHLHVARSEAITRNAYVALCPSSDGQECLDDFAWHRGFILFLDTNNNKIRDAGEEVLRSHQSETHHIEIFTSTGRRSVQYKPDGILAGFSNATFTFCDPNERMAPKKITIRNGRLLISSTGDSERCI